MVVVVAVGFVVLVGREEVVAVEPGTAVVDGPVAVVLVGSPGGSLPEVVSSPDPSAVVTVGAVACVVSVVRPACSADFDPSKEAPATPTVRTATRMRICAQRGKFRNRFQRLMTDGEAQA